MGYPKQDARFLDLSIRGICTDLKGKEHAIEKDLITSKSRSYLSHCIFSRLLSSEAIIRRKDEVNSVISTVVFSIGDVQLYERNQNKLNYIIIPVSVSFVILLFVMTFFLRRMRFVQQLAGGFLVSFDHLL